MATPFSTPDWFYGTDVVLNTLALITVVIIAFYALRIFKLTKHDKFKYFSLAFFSIALGFLFKIGTDTFLYLVLKQGSFLGVTGFQVTANPLYYLVPFFFFHFFTLLGFIGIFCLAHEIKSAKVVLLFAYLITVSSWFVNSTYLSYHVTAAVILLGIFTYYFQNLVQKKKKNIGKSNRIVTTSFFLLFLSEVIFVFLSRGQTLYSIDPYVLGEVVRVAGFLLLLVNFIHILKK